MSHPELSPEFILQALPIPTYIPLGEYPKEPQRKSQKSSRDFPCPDCSNIYRSPRDQRRHHLVIHRPEEAEKKKFVCTFSGCNHKSAQPSNLKIHYLTAHCERSKVDQPCPLASDGCTWRWVDTAARTRHMQRVHSQKPHHRPDYKGRATPETTKRRKVESTTLLDDAKRVAAARVANLQKARRVHISTKPAILPTEAPSTVTSSHLESSSAASASGSPLALISSSSPSSPVLNSLEDTVHSTPSLCPQASLNTPRSDSSDSLDSSITSFFEYSASSVPTLRSRRISFPSSRSSSPPYIPTITGNTGSSSPLVVQSPPPPPESFTGITSTSMSTPEPTFDRSKKQLFA
ncbi:uncharacterized protein STEHIDRAFT_111993 [Stereum hirsutum FP-91666 SS1]|uniref:uncharacterized protein n=1 Tax=Stereum hirsutum (strain FP-91666) TaxID=721885 RepID=UPI0004449D92|nr:uncharacterized protein STEHIDRAFT_111993 [Stereum hirsutum FP-91666 SS1]EIM85407.1 hypothetical protein STEHIDRAFT_111993 [Stereum hirsutum FP-91666 SS1]